MTVMTISADRIRSSTVTLFSFTVYMDLGNSRFAPQSAQATCAKFEITLSLFEAKFGVFPTYFHICITFPITIMTLLDTRFSDVPIIVV